MTVQANLSVAILIVSPSRASEMPLPGRDAQLPAATRRAAASASDGHCVANSHPGQTLQIDSDALETAATALTRKVPLQCHRLLAQARRPPDHRPPDLGFKFQSATNLVRQVVPYGLVYRRVGPSLLQLYNTL